MKAIIVVVVLFCTINAFNIQTEETILNQLPQVIPWPFTVCGEGQWKIKSLTLGGQPARNINDDIDVSGTATDDTSFTTADVLVKLNGVFLHNESVDYKKSYQEGDTVDFKYQNFIPSFAPAGTYSITFNFKNGSKDNGCVSFSFKL